MKYILSILALFATLMSSAQESKNYIENEVLVQFTKGTHPSDVYSEMSASSLLIINSTPISKRLNFYQIVFESETMSEREVAALFMTHPNVVLADVNHTGIQLRDTTPNDPSFSNQWAFDNTSNGRINAQQAWDISTGGLTSRGDTIVIAVIDGGADLDHEDIDFFKNIHEIPGNGIDDDTNGYVDDYDGYNAYNQTGNVFSSSHGTHVSGIIGAKGNNALGVTGVNWNVKIMPISGSSSNEATVLRAYGYVLEMRARYNETDGDEGAFVVATNSSFGVDFGNPANYPLWCSFYDSLGAAGILSCGATANMNIDVDQVGDVPTACASEYMIAVTNLTSSGTKYNNAGYGTTSIDIAAPGSNIYSTVPNDAYNYSTGTSMATPMVAGTIGLIYSALCKSDIENRSVDSLALYVRDLLYDHATTNSNLNSFVSGSRQLNAFDPLSVLDSNGCFGASFEVTDDLCGRCEGAFQVDVYEANGPISIEWTNDEGDSGVRMDSLCPGIYSITITDSVGQQMVDSIEIIGNDTLAYTYTILPSTGINDGSINLNILGGTTPYEVFWNDGSTGTTLDNAAPGTYSFEIVDTNGCMLVDSIYLYSTGVEEYGGITPLNLYPNPASNFITLGNYAAFEVIEIRDMQGRLLLRRNSRKSIDISTLPDGMYLISGDHQQVERLIILR